MSDALPPRIPVPAAVAPLIDAILGHMRPSAIWLFGSHARGDARPDSDWDFVVSLPDDADAALLDPLVGWHLQRQAGVRATILATRSGDLAMIWGLPNTIGFDLAREGRMLDV